MFKSTQNGNQQQEEERIYLPNDTLRYAFNQTGQIGSFVLVPKPGIHARVVERDVAYGPRTGGKSKVSGSVRGSLIAALDFWRVIS